MLNQLTYHMTDITVTLLPINSNMVEAVEIIVRIVIGYRRAERGREMG